jgi:23S rRNA (adenine2030-N6)-methyltransferase
VLSYQHAYHAGNAADCHKHLALVMLLRRLQQKATPLCYVDSHAGGGVYDLKSTEARKTRDAEHGILRLAAAADPPAAVRDYLALVAEFNSDGGMRRYPGSAALAQALLREQDRAILLELHPQEFAALKVAIGRDRRVSLHERDCYEGLPALLPPPMRRGLVLIDPSYEIKDEYEDSVRLLGEALRRFATGVFMLWYPLLPDARHARLHRALADLAPPKTLISEFRFLEVAVGLQGSGLAIVNTPWQFEEELARAMEHLVVDVTEDGGGDGPGEGAVDGAGDSARAGPGPGRYEQRWLTGP